MVYVMWTIRQVNQKFDTSRIYDAHPTLFTFELHHGGRFTRFPELEYIGGVVRYVDLVDIDEFFVHELDAMMLELGYTVPPVIYYHFRIPNADFVFGLRALGNDQDVILLSRYIGENKVIQVYTEHGQTNLLTYFMSPQGNRRVVIEEIEEEVVNEGPTEAALPTNNDVNPVENVEDTLSGNDQQMGDDLSLMLYGSQSRHASPEYNTTRRGHRSGGEGSCSRRLFIEDLNKLPSPDLNEDVHTTMGGAGSYAVEGDKGYQDVEGDKGYQADDGDDSFEDYELDYMNVSCGGDDGDAGYYEFRVDDSDNAHEEDYILDDADNGDEVHVHVEDTVHKDGVNDCNRDDGEAADNDNIHDKENTFSDVEVDMDDFRFHIDNDVGCMGGNDGSNEQDTDVDWEALDIINNDVWDSCGEDSDEDRKRRALLKQLGKERRCSQGEVHNVSFYCGQKFITKKELKDKIDLHALETRRNLYFKKNDNTRLKALCGGVVPVMNAIGKSGTAKSKGKGKEVISGNENCSWSLHASRSDLESHWFIKTLNRTHTCLQTRKVRACTATFISKQIMSQVEANPDVPLVALQDQFQKKYEVGVSLDKVFRAKAASKKLIVGDYTKQYDILRDYVLELQSTNEDTTVKIDVVSDGNPASPSRQFKRIYICLGPLKKGFKAGLRDLIGLDGAFMKGPFPGQVLSAVGIDSNNGIYRVAYGVVETENKASWKWFLDALGDDLELGSNSNFTFITDRQKGLIGAIAELFPCAEHRYCLRHIYDNMRQKWKVVEYKQHLWKCASAATLPEFEQCMRDFSEYDREACQWLKDIPAQHWARSHFSGRAISDVMINNMCEVFNGKIIHGRDKPIIGCLEYIREYLMKRICNVMKEMKKAKGPLTPTATTILDSHKDQASQYNARWNGGDKYQVTGAWQDQHVVDVKQGTCTCRKWELIGIPCKHAIATLNEMTKNSEGELDIYKWVHELYYLDTWKKAYEFKVEPIKGRGMWPRSSCPTKLIPPPHQKPVGRPKKKRRQSQGEKLANSQRASQTASQPNGVHVAANGVEKLTKRYMQVRCSKCKNKGHNARTCKGQGGVGGGVTQAA